MSKVDRKPNNSAICAYSNVLAADVFAARL